MNAEAQKKLGTNFIFQKASNEGAASKELYNF